MERYRNLELKEKKENSLKILNKPHNGIGIKKISEYQPLKCKARRKPIIKTKVPKYVTSNVLC